MLRLRRVIFQGRGPGLLAIAVAGLVALAFPSCGPANDRPRSGAVPGSEARTPVGVPPTLTASDGLPLHVAASPSPGAAGPSPAGSPSPLASPSVVAAPPIVRTIAPGAGGRVP